MRRATLQMMRPVRGHAGLRPVEFRSGQRIECKRRPITNQKDTQRQPLISLRTESQQVEESIPQPDLRERVLERVVSLALPDGTQKDPQRHQQKCAPESVPGHDPRDCPRARRLAIEKGSATPTMNENDGWIMSCREQPTQGT